MRILLLAAAVALVTSIAGCGEDPGTTPDGGLPIEIDAFVPPIEMDGGPPPPECQGLAPTCSTLDDATCVTVTGCAVSNCAGTAVLCPDYDTQSTCEATAGCRWAGTGCSGTATSCERIAGEPACDAQQGCRWEDTASCHGRSIRCESLSRGECESQPGCTAIEIDGGPPTPVDGGPRDGGPVVCVPPEGPPTSPGCNPDDGIECDGDWRGVNRRTGSEYCSPACSASQCCTPRGGVFECVARSATGTCPAPDLFIDEARITDDYEIVERTFSESSCEMVEGCIAAPGRRRLLRFDTWTPNIGTSDMFLGEPDTSVPYFEFSACHGHYHFNTYAEYELLDESGECVVATGHKQAFCLLDFYPYPDPSGPGRETYTCGYQGIQMNWQDVYGRDLDCQWVDVTDVPPGNYQLRIRVNVEHLLNETNYANNEITVPVVID